MTLGNMRARLNERLMKAPALAAFLIFCMSAVPSAASDDIPQLAFLGLLFPAFRTPKELPGESEKCHVWTAPSWQGESSRRIAGRCSHVFGLLVRFT
jgi:hypothetical protein